MKKWKLVMTVTALTVLSAICILSLGSCSPEVATAALADDNGTAQLVSSDKCNGDCTACEKRNGGCDGTCDKCTGDCANCEKDNCKCGTTSEITRDKAGGCDGCMGCGSSKIWGTDTPSETW
jgi:hypothetical protein